MIFFKQEERKVNVLMSAFLVFFFSSVHSVDALKLNASNFWTQDSSSSDSDDQKAFEAAEMQAERARLEQFAKQRKLTKDANHAFAGFKKGLDHRVEAQKKEARMKAQMKERMYIEKHAQSQEPIPFEDLHKYSSSESEDVDQRLGVEQLAQDGVQQQLVQQEYENWVEERKFQRKLLDVFEEIRSALRKEDFPFAIFIAKGQFGDDMANDLRSYVDEKVKVDDIIDKLKESRKSRLKKCAETSKTAEDFTYKCRLDVSFVLDWMCRCPGRKLFSFEDMAEKRGIPESELKFALWTGFKGVPKYWKQAAWNKGVNKMEYIFLGDTKLGQAMEKFQSDPSDMPLAASECHQTDNPPTAKDFINFDLDKWKVDEMWKYVSKLFVEACKGHGILIYNLPRDPLVKIQDGKAAPGAALESTLHELEKRVAFSVELPAVYSNQRITGITFHALFGYTYFCDDDEIREFYVNAQDAQDLSKLLKGKVDKNGEFNQDVNLFNPTPPQTTGKKAMNEYLFSKGSRIVGLHRLGQPERAWTDGGDLCVLVEEGNDKDVVFKVFVHNQNDFHRDEVWDILARLEHYNISTWVRGEEDYGITMRAIPGVSRQWDPYHAWSQEKGDLRPYEGPGKKGQCSCKTDSSLRTFSRRFLYTVLLLFTQFWTLGSSSFSRFERINSQLTAWEIEALAVRMTSMYNIEQRRALQKWFSKEAWPQVTQCCSECKKEIASWVEKVRKEHDKLDGVFEFSEFKGAERFAKYYYDSSVNPVSRDGVLKRQSNVFSKDFSYICFGIPLPKFPAPCANVVPVDSMQPEILDKIPILDENENGLNGWRFAPREGIFCRVEHFDPWNPRHLGLAYHMRFFLNVVCLVLFPAGMLVYLLRIFGCVSANQYIDGSFALVVASKIISSYLGHLNRVKISKLYDIVYATWFEKEQWVQTASPILQVRQKESTDRVDFKRVEGVLEPFVEPKHENMKVRRAKCDVTNHPLVRRLNDFLVLAPVVLGSCGFSLPRIYMFMVCFPMWIQFELINHFEDLDHFWTSWTDDKHVTAACSELLELRDPVILDPVAMSVSACRQFLSNFAWKALQRIFKFVFSCALFVIYSTLFSCFFILYYKIWLVYGDGRWYQLACVLSELTKSVSISIILARVMHELIARVMYHR